jgi:hypothetical protein
MKIRYKPEFIKKVKESKPKRGCVNCGKFRKFVLRQGVLRTE